MKKWIIVPFMVGIMAVCSLGYLNSQDEIDIVQYMDVFVRSFASGEGEGQYTESGMEEEEWKDNCQTKCEDGKCNTILGRTEWVNDTDGKCKGIKEANSLKGYYKQVYLKEDSNYEIEIEEFNYNYIKKIKLKSEIDGYIPFKINDVEFISPYFEAGEEIELEDIYVDNILAYNFTLGESSTTIKLQDADTENLEDTYANSDEPDTSFGDASDLGISDTSGFGLIWRPYIKFNISGIPSEMIIDEAILYLHCTGFDFGDGVITDAYHVYNQTWSEDALTWNNQPCGTDFDDSEQCNLDALSGNLSIIAKDVWTGWNVTEGVSSDYDSSKHNFSAALKTRIEDATTSLGAFYSKEYGTASKRPYLNITYSEAIPEDTCNPDSPLIADHDFDCDDNCEETGTLDCDGNSITTSNKGSGSIIFEQNPVNCIGVTLGCNYVTQKS